MNLRERGNFVPAYLTGGFGLGMSAMIGFLIPLQASRLGASLVVIGLAVSTRSITEGVASVPLVVRRGFDLVEGGSSAADLCDDLFGGLVPDEGLGVVVPVFGPDLDGIDEVGHAGEHASA